MRNRFVSGQYPISPDREPVTTATTAPRWLRLVDVQMEIAAQSVPARAPRKCSDKPGVRGVLIGQRYNRWWIRAQLMGGKVEAICLDCMRTYERDEHSIVSGESTKCGRFAADSRRAG